MAFPAKALAVQSKGEPARSGAAAIADGELVVGVWGKEASHEAKALGEGLRGE
jgi:hypothetical protein